MQGKTPAEIAGIKIEGRTSGSLSYRMQVAAKLTVKAIADNPALLAMPYNVYCEHGGRSVGVGRTRTEADAIYRKYRTCLSHRRKSPLAAMFEF